MGVSISKSTAYTDMKKKAKQRAASRSKQTFHKNSVKGLIEGKRLGKENQKQARNPQKVKTLHTNHPIETLAQSSHKISEINTHIQNSKQFSIDTEFTNGVANNRKILSSLKKSLQLPEQSTHEDEYNNEPTEEFTKAEASNKKSQKNPSCFTIYTKNKIDFANTDLGSKPYLSRKSIEGMGIARCESHPVTKKMIEDPFSNLNDWRTSEDSPEVDMRFIGPRSITLSNKFAQMGSHLQEKNRWEPEHKAIPMKVIVGSRRTRVS